MKILIPILLLLIASSATAAPGAGVHLGLDFGIWRNWYTQEGYGLTREIASDFAPGFKGHVGFTVGPIFVDYTPEAYRAYWGGARDADTGEANDMDYFTLLSGNIGIQIPFIRLRPYVGGGIGNLGFQAGTKADPSGPFIRVGVTWDILAKGPIALGPRLEWQRLFLRNDDAGHLADHYSARSSMIFLGLGARFGY